MNQPTRPTQLSPDEFRALLVKVNAPSDFVEEELERWRARGLIREPEPEPPVEVALALELKTAVFQDERSRVPYSNGFRRGFERAEELTHQNAAGFLLRMAEKAREACYEEEMKPDMGDVFWRRYWTGYFTGLEYAAKELNTDSYRFELLNLNNLETVIADAMASGNEITPYEIATAVRARFANLVEDCIT